MCTTLVARDGNDLDRQFLGFHVLAHGRSVCGGRHKAYGEGMHLIAEWGVKSELDELLFYIAEDLELVRGQFGMHGGCEALLWFD